MRLLMKSGYAFRNDKIDTFITPIHIQRSNNKGCRALCSLHKSQFSDRLGVGDL